MFKNGDKVRVKEGLEVGKKYGESTFCDDMEKYNILTIERHIGYDSYCVKENKRIWTVEMLEPINESKKHDSDKLRWDLLPIECMEECVKVLTFGSKEKYGANTWQKLDDFENRYYAAALRHLSEWRKGEKIDPESGLNHLSHLLTNVVFLLWKELND